MNKTVVIYKTKSGSTKKYAEFIKEELNADIFDLKDIKKINLNNYENIIFGGWVFAFKIMGLNKFKKYIKNLQNKKVVTFSVGMPDVSDQEYYNRILNLNKKELYGIKLFNLRGAFNLDKAGFFIKFFLDIAKKDIEYRIKNNQQISKDDKFFVDNFMSNKDFIKKENIKPIIDYILN